MKIRSKVETIAVAILGVFCWLAPGLAAAQTPKPAAPPTHKALTGPRAAGIPRNMKRLAKELGLSQAQQAKIRPLLADEAKKIREIRASTRTKMVAVLTPAQKKKLEALLKQQNNATAPARRPAGAGPKK